MAFSVFPENLTERVADEAMTGITVLQQGKWPCFRFKATDYDDKDPEASS